MQYIHGFFGRHAQRLTNYPCILQQYNGAHAVCNLSAFNLMKKSFQFACYSYRQSGCKTESNEPHTQKEMPEE
jgi:hypothetical protein